MKNFKTLTPRLCKTCVIFISFISSFSPAFAETVFIQPGQCIVIGTQQVCAMKPDAVTEPTAAKTIYVCRYGMHKDAEVSNMKSHQLFQVVVKPDGSKSEIALKNFGMNGKDACEKDAEAKTAAEKK
jgi:hypothetical protein